MNELTTDELHAVSGGRIWGHIGLAIAVADAAYDFYLGYSENRR